MLDILLLKKALMSAGIRKVIDLIPAFRADDPQTIKKKYYLDVIRKLKAKYPPAPENEYPDQTKYSILESAELKAHARWYAYRAQMYWGRTDLRDRFRSAWLNATAGSLYELANDANEASNYFHFAANTLREVQSFRASIEFYLKASELASGGWIRRNLERALGVAHYAGDETTEKDIRDKIADLR